MSRRRERAQAPAPRASVAAKPVAAAAPRPVAPPLARSARIPGIDALRGAAILLMFVYHFCFDLRYFRVIASDFERDPF